MLKVLKQKNRMSWVLSVLVLMILASTFFNGSSRAAELTTEEETVNAEAYAATTIALNPGANESELRFTWYSPRNPAGTVVQIAKKSDMTGTDFPVDKAQAFTGVATNAVTNFSSNKVTITGLAPSTTYIYRVGDGTDGNWSQAYTYKTTRTDSYRIMFVGDPQIGAGSAETDRQGWQDTLTKAVAKFPDFSFIMSGGDQVETSTSEDQYSKYLSPEELRSLPVATVVGNHDTAINYQYHFNQPNESTQYGVTAGAGGDYYYTYGDTLFMVLNTNSASNASHNTFMEETVAANPNFKWRIVTFHHSIYSAGPHSTEDGIKNLRAALFPTLEKLNVDMVFMGHDHSYVRTYNMKNDQVQSNQTIDEKGRIINPNGITYMTANSASGSKYYDLKVTPEIYSEVRSQIKIPTFSTIKIDQGSITVDTYRTDNMTIVDSYGMVKTGMDGIEVVPPTKKDYDLYETDTLDTTGMNVSKMNRDGSKTPVALTDLTITGFDTMTVGTKKITVAYNAFGVNYSQSFDINVTAPNIKIYSKKDTVVSDNEKPVVEFYLALSKAKAVNALDATFKYDSTKFKFKQAELIDQSDIIVKAVDNGTGTVRLLAGFTKSITSTTYTDVIKLTLEPINPNNRYVQADVTLINAVTASSGINQDVLSNNDGNKAAIIIRTFKDLVDINGDGYVTLADFSTALDSYRLTPASPNWEKEKRSDVDFDNLVDLTDLTIIMNGVIKYS